MPSLISVFPGIYLLFDLKIVFDALYFKILSKYVVADRRKNARIESASAPRRVYHSFQGAVPGVQWYPFIV